MQTRNRYSTYYIQIKGCTLQKMLVTGYGYGYGQFIFLSLDIDTTAILTLHQEKYKK